MKTYSKTPWWYQESRKCECLGCRLISTPFGKERRKIIMDFLNNNFGGMSVNSKHHLQVKKDPDLKRLIKKGKIALCSNKVFAIKKDV